MSDFEKMFPKAVRAGLLTGAYIIGSLFVSVAIKLILSLFHIHIHLSPEWVNFLFFPWFFSIIAVAVWLGKREGL